jgi:hypothetical protein
MAIFDVALLIVPRFFSVGSGIVQFGLRAVMIDSEKMDYSQFSKICQSLEMPKGICEGLNDMEIGGKVLFAFVTVDLIVLIFYFCINFLQLFVAHRILSKGNGKLEVSYFEKWLLKLCHNLRVVIIAHPFAVTIGLGVWIKLSNIEKFSNVISLKEGIILLIIQSFFSLLSIAGFLWENSSLKRRVARLKNNYHLKYSQQAEQRGVDSFNGTNDEKSLEINVSIE